METTSKGTSSTTFEPRASDALQRLRGTFADVIDALPDTPTKAADLHRNLKLDMMLCWRIFKVIGAPTPLAAGPHVPSSSKIRAFLGAAGRQGVPDIKLTAVTKATAAFERVIEVDAGDRVTFDAMVSSLVNGEDAVKLYMQQKRAAFRAQRHVLGVQARTQFRCVAIQHSKDPLFVDYGVLGGLIDMQVSRSNVRTLVSRIRSFDDDASNRTAMTPIPLDEECDPTDGVGAIRRFCSTPLPELSPVRVRAGETQYELVCPDIGKQTAVTHIQGYYHSENLPRYRSENNAFASLRHFVHTPCEVLVYDLMINRETYRDFSPSTMVFSEHLSGFKGEFPGSDRDRLRWDENIAYLGHGPSALRTPDVPRYVEMGEFLFERLGWNPDAFDVYRCRVEYPVIPSAVGIRFELPEAPVSG